MVYKSLTALIFVRQIVSYSFHMKMNVYIHLLQREEDPYFVQMSLGYVLGGVINTSRKR